MFEPALFVMLIDNLPLPVCTCIYIHTAVSRKVVEKNVHATIPKGNVGYD